jgi:hypothetical protein
MNTTFRSDYRITDLDTDVDETVVRIDRWYDRSSRCYIIAAKNAAGDQVGDAGVECNRADADSVEADMRKAAGL